MESWATKKKNSNVSDIIADQKVIFPEKRVAKLIP